MFFKNNLEKYITKMSLKDLEKFCGFFSEKQKENNKIIIFFFFVYRLRWSGQQLMRV